MSLNRRRQIGQRHRCLRSKALYWVVSIPYLRLRYASLASALVLLPTISYYKLFYLTCLPREILILLTPLSNQDHKLIKLVLRQRSLVRQLCCSLTYRISEYVHLLSPGRQVDVRPSSGRLVLTHTEKSVD